MISWSWKQTIADILIDLVNQKHSVEFDLSDVYSFEEELSAKFPNNKNIRPKIRQTLQRLRDIGFIEFSQERGNYRLNLNYEDLDVVSDLSNPDQPEFPETRTAVRTIRLRNTLLSTDMKRRYRNFCQVCDTALQLSMGTYSEAHHIKPIGAPHFGPDIEGNILVLCPNHHVMFDRGAIIVNPNSLFVSHSRSAFPATRLMLLDWHQIAPEFLRYYLDKICVRPN